MYVSETGTIILEVNDKELKPTIIEFMFVKMPGISRYSDYVELIIEYEKGQCPYNNDEEFQEYVESKREYLTLIYSEEPSNEGNAYFTKLIYEALIKKGTNNAMVN